MAFYSIDIVTTTAQTADITVALPGTNAKTFGDMTITAHTGDFDCIITGVTGHNFGVWTLGTPDATHWSDVQRTAGTDINVTSFVAAGCADHTTYIKSVTNATHTWSDTTGTNTVNYCTISYSIAEGGATWLAPVCVNGLNNTGWIFGYILSVASGAMTLAGTSLGLKVDREFPLISGILTINGTTLDIKADRKFSISSGALTLNGQPLTMLSARQLAILAGALTINGTSITFLYSRLTLGSGIIRIEGGYMSLVCHRLLPSPIIDWVSSYKGLGPWAFIPQGDKPRYNDGDVIALSPALPTGTPVWNMTDLAIGATPTTPIHQPWCGYWIKGYVYTALPTPSAIILTQHVVEVLRLGEPYARLGQETIEVLRLGVPYARLGQEVIEVLRGS